MASFFQPPSSGDPTIESCNTTRGFQIYCNSALPADHRLRHWSQKANFVIGVIALGLPVLLGLLTAARHFWKSARRGRAGSRPKRSLQRSRSQQSLPQFESFKSVRSFRLLPSGSPISGSALGSHDLQIIDVWATNGARGVPIVPKGPAAQPRRPGAVVLGYVDLNLLGSDPVLESRLQDTVDLLVSLNDGSATDGLVLRPLRLDGADDSRRDEFNAILEQLSDRKVPVLAICDHDDAYLPLIDLGFAGGVIVENACILRNGERRDFFRSAPLRRLAAECSGQLTKRPSFFFGFHDLWDKQPSPAVVRRAFKLAEHFGAAYEHGSAKGSAAADAVTSASLSGFEYLRRPETLELQKAWITETRKVRIEAKPEFSKSEVAALDLDELASVLPDAGALLTAQPLSEQLATLQSECPRLVDPPEYVDFLPQTADFWDLSCNNEPFSPHGCFPIITGASQGEYEAVVKTQTHLRDLKMLEVLEDAEVEKVLEQLRAFRNMTQYPEAVEALIDSLTSRTAVIYRGLATGFRIQGSGAAFWGVSSPNENCIDIFISKSAPSVVDTVLHVWFAANGVARAERFEEELRLDMLRVSGSAHATGLPISIRAEIERSTPSEVLFLLQRLRQAQAGHPLIQAIQAYSEHILLDLTEETGWREAHSRRYLNGELDFVQLLQIRLEKFARRGAPELPTLDNLVQLHNLVERTVHQSLFAGDRETLNALTDILLHAYDPWTSWGVYGFVDINADLFALIFFAVLRKAALNDVYVEATDRCPFFLSQPDQAAVFAELWSVGSQCQGYFGLAPRDLGQIVYDRYRDYLKGCPPPAEMDGRGLMTCYANPTDILAAEKKPGAKGEDELDLPYYGGYGSIIGRWTKAAHEFGAISIFCFPAMIDVMLLSFVGRGLFVTAFMELDYLEMGCYALLISLLLASGVTGLVGSVGSYYLSHYAYDNMILFHVQRLSGGFVLTIIVAVVGLAAFCIKRSVAAGFIFVAYLVAISIYLYLLGIMATMHQRGSPLTSGRSVLWRTIPLLFISPILSSLVNGHDLKIYLPVMYGFLLVTLIQYRKLCHEWSSWLTKVPTLTSSDVEDWYSAKLGDPQSDTTSTWDKDGAESESVSVLAQRAFRQTVRAHSQRLPGASGSDILVSEVSRGLPYAQWLLRKGREDDESAIPEPFSNAWFAELQSALKTQQQMSRSLKEHSVFMLFRFARFDLGQNVALFLICLMDRWVDIATSTRDPNLSIYVDARARYGIGLCIIYFCAAVMALDATLHEYWGDRFKRSEEKLTDTAHAKDVERRWEWHRRARYCEALYTLGTKLVFLAGVAVLLLWLLVENPQSILLFWLYLLGYTGVMISQFNRCFTTDVTSHLTVVFVSALVGFTCGCILQGVPATRPSIYNNVIALDVAALLAAGLSSIWVWFDFHLPKTTSQSTVAPPSHGRFEQKRLIGDSHGAVFAETPALPDIHGFRVTWGTQVETASKITSLLKASLDQPNEYSKATTWSKGLLESTLGMWLTESIILNVTTRRRMEQHGLPDVLSFSFWDSGVLRITAGFLDDEETASVEWQQLLAALLTECILYHASRALLSHDNTHAVQAEHFVTETEYLSRRIELELATTNTSAVHTIQKKTVSEVLRHLCLNVDVDTCWPEIPVAARHAILCRVAGKQVPLSWEFGKWMQDASVDQQTTEFHLDLSIGIHQRAIERSKTLLHQVESESTLCPTPSSGESLLAAEFEDRGSVLHTIGSAIVSVPVATVKWAGIITGAGADVQRELWFCLRNSYFRDTILRLILIVWKACWLIKNGWVYALLIYHRSTLTHISRLARKGASRVLKKNTIVVELSRKALTGFASKNEQGTLTLDIFPGRLEVPPADKQPASVAVYDEACRLTNTTEKGDGDKRVSTYQYGTGNNTRWPNSKEVIQGSTTMLCHYDGAGRISHGILTLDSRQFIFQYSYKTVPRGNDDILKADFRLANSESRDSMTVYWGSPTRSDSTAKWATLDWVPSDRVCCIMRFVDGKTYVTTWEYTHRRDPIVTTFLQDGVNKTVVTQVPRVFDEEDLLSVRPSHVSFVDDDLLIHHRRSDIRRMAAFANRDASVLSGLNPLRWSYNLSKAQYHRVPTWWLRTELWNHWLTAGTVDAVTACWMDEVILREEPLLVRYWRARDLGRLAAAKSVLDSNIEQIVAAIEIQKEVSEVCLMPIKAADLYVMGHGKDANQITNRPEECFQDSKDRISVIFNDIGCWPEAPGGVSNCRRDLINGHSTIRNHVLAETANDYGIPRFQVEKSVQSLKLLPLWGIDGKTPNHGILDNLLQSQVDRKIRNTDVRHDVGKSFVPLIKLLVRGARSKKPTRAELQQYSQVFIAFSNFFEKKDYNTTWQSKEVMNAWAEAWLAPQNDTNASEPASCFEIEQPSMKDFQDALAIYTSYFFIFSVQVPEDCPRVFQSTHHGISSLFGLILKYRRGTTFGIWDHAILWRECCLNISPAQCTLSIPVQSMLLAGIGLATRLAYFHADVIVPCTSVFNPVWEAELGTDRGRLMHREQFARKIDPIVNGISDMESFVPVDKIESKTPTVVMLSNVQFIKDIKTAVMAADVIVNRYGFTDYKLLVYGAQDRQPAYAIEMSKLIATYNLADHVTLAGFGSPREVLRNAWLFMNSSISEGLPLAIGEAALAGVPIVATEVGSTALVLTDPDDPTQRYGEVVPPNDAVALARAQLSILAMVGPWSRFTADGAAAAAGSSGDAPSARGNKFNRLSRPSIVLPDVIAEKDVAWLTKRMYDRADDRRRLGLRARDVVLRSFHGKRYLREHEQMYWIQWHIARMKADGSLTAAARALRYARSTPMLAYVEESDDEKGGIQRKKSLRWQDFPSNSYRGKQLSRQRDERGGVTVRVQPVEEEV